MENNLAETAFYAKQGDKYQIRWFTPKLEVDLCGYAYVLFNHENHPGNLAVTKNKLYNKIKKQNK